MPYVSNKLCHFVGRSCKNDQERLELLMKIIRSGKLLANPRNPNKSPQIGMRNIHDGVNSLGEVQGQIDCVCFCDIPDDELNLHTKKYSKFGLGFKREFLVSLGTRPVTYVPKCNSMYEAAGDSILGGTPEKYFASANRIGTFYPVFFEAVNCMKYNTLSLYRDGLANGTVPKELSKLIEDAIPEILTESGIHQLSFALVNFVATTCAYVKIFDSELPENSPENFYMEREWRCLQNVEFTLDDIVNVYMPESEIMSEIFIKQFPKLSNKIIYL